MKIPIFLLWNPQGGGGEGSLLIPVGVCIPKKIENRNHSTIHKYLISEYRKVIIMGNKTTTTYYKCSNTDVASIEKELINIF